MADSYFDPIAPVLARIAGVALLAAAAGLTIALGYAIFAVVGLDGNRRSFTSSSLIFGLILLALCGICWQAGFRLAFNRPGPDGSLFSRPAWFAIGSALLFVTAAMVSAILTTRTPTGLDYWVVVTLAALGVWCIILAFRPVTRQAA